MSAQVIEFSQLQARKFSTITRQPLTEPVSAATLRPENAFESHLPIKFIQHMLDAPHPTREELLLEAYLLECD